MRANVSLRFLHQIDVDFAANEMGKLVAAWETGRREAVK